MHSSLKKVVSKVFGKKISSTSLQSRLTIELLAISVISLGGVSFWAGLRMEQCLINSNKQTLDRIAMRFPEQVEMLTATDTTKSAIERSVKRISSSGLGVWLQTNDGQTYGRNISNDDSGILENIDIAKSPEIVKVSDNYFAASANTLTLRNEVIGKFYIFKNITYEQKDLENAIYSLIGINLFVVIILIWLIFNRVHRALLPLEKMSEIANIASIENLSAAKLQLEQAPDEIRGLTTAFNEMLQRFSGSCEQQRQFVGNVSHELRTPLTVISGYLQSLLRRGDNLSSYQQQALETASAETERTIQMLEDLLDMARADSGNLHFRESPVFLNTLAVEVADMCAKVSDRSVKLLPLDQDIVALADQDRLQQVLINLVDNAIKYSADPVEISLSRNADQAIINVRDQGIGISLQHQNRIFERFYRAEEASIRSRDGTGLGLAITKSLIEGMNGKISLRSKPNEGSIFTITLPIWKPQP